MDARLFRPEPIGLALGAGAAMKPSRCAPHLVDVDGRGRHVTADRPAKLNALTPEMLASSTHAVPVARLGDGARGRAPRRR